VALNTGLPITERQNHSYRVSYYEPAGTDATIYDPNPDLKFVNDTGRYILFLTKIEGDNLIFEFWGTKDGRQVEQFPDPPKIYDIKIPAAAKIIETTDLPVGQKKCTERAHKGATTEFTYRVTYPSGEIKTKLFKSVYVPWQEVCLVGVEKIVEPVTNIKPDETANLENVNKINNSNININAP
jgi:vancomycin resistance protein YoaR